LANAPGEKGFKKGSGLATSQDSLIYCLKGGAKTNEFYVYNIWDSSWRKLASLPLEGSTGRNKRIRDGGALIFAYGKCYALKGGNTLEFWEFTPPTAPTDTGQWTELEPLPLLPSGKKVKGGGALTATQNYIYALKGAKTSEFWVWYDWRKPLLGEKVVALGLVPKLAESVERSETERKSCAECNEANNHFWLPRTSLGATILNTNNRTLRIVDVKSPDTKLEIYNSCGRKILSNPLHPNRAQTVFLQTLASGIYFIRLTAHNINLETKKIIVIK
jgi:hypothetical protein